MSQSEIERAEAEVRRSNAAFADALDHLKAKVGTSTEKAGRLLGMARHPGDSIGGIINGYSGYAKQHFAAGLSEIGALWQSTSRATTRLTSETVRDPQRLALVAVVGGATIGLFAGLRSRAISKRLDPNSRPMREFLDRCRARFLFERTGTELYEELLSKCPMAARAEITEIRDEERAHAALLEAIIRAHGSDPHELTDAARITLLESSGIVNVVKHESFAGALDALLAAELVDNAGWDLLRKLARSLGLAHAAERFDEVIREEAKHLKYIRNLMTRTALARLKHQSGYLSY